MKNNQHGITLVELLVAITIMVVIIVPIVTLVTMFMGTHVEVMEENALQHEARFIMEYLTRSIQEVDQWVSLTLDSQNRLWLNNEVMLWYDNSSGSDLGNRLLAGQEGAMILSEQVHSDTAIALDSEKIEIKLVLANQTDGRYELRTTLYKRNKINY